MMARPPKTEKELLERYAAGERAFERASLEGADLPGANLEGANLRGADLRGANLRDASLKRAYLREAELRHADLQRADLEYATLARANLRAANLQDTELQGANIRATSLEEARLGGAVLGRTILASLDLSSLIDAQPGVRYFGASIVDFGSVLLSVHHHRLRDFLLRTGMPEVFVTYMIDCAKSVEYHVTDLLRSTFISYGGRVVADFRGAETDEDVFKNMLVRLMRALQKKGPGA